MIILDYFNISAGNPSIILVALVLWFPLLQSFWVLCHLSNRFPWTHTWPFTLVNWNPSIVSFAKNPPSPAITFWLYLYALTQPCMHWFFHNCTVRHPIVCLPSLLNNLNSRIIAITLFHIPSTHLDPLKSVDTHGQPTMMIIKRCPLRLCKNKAYARYLMFSP